ncbi:MAG: DEAD/DEAH box helicase, partial [Sulfuricurvum sp.]|nr:DEAD/DEAH box helicase [Sulfuricurvum sp.]
IGRTGRAGKKGVAITLVTPIEFKELQRIKSKVGTTMEHAYIPSKIDVKEAQVNRLLKEIEKQPVYDEAHKILDALKEEFDQEQIAYKLISLLMERNTVAGPNQIGISAERMEKILHNLANSHDRGGNRSGGFNRNRSGGGGGYRGNNDRNAGGGDRGGSGGGGYRGNNDRNAGSGDRSGADRGAGDRSRSFSGQNRSATSKPRS